MKYMENSKLLIISIAATILLLGTIRLTTEPDTSYTLDTERPSTTQDNSEAVNRTIETVTTDLKVPWDIEFLPDGDMLVTERPGQLLRIGENNTAYEIEGVESVGEGGLLGIEKHPEFEENRFIYIYQTTETGEGLTNRVMRYRLKDDELSSPETIIDGIPGAIYHDGGALAFGPDGYLFITAGDATEKQESQETESLNGKILRLNPNGSIPDSNPFDNPIYSYGHRNPQGLTWDSQGRMWATEHGSTATDEINMIEKGTNYGWPIIRGNEKQGDMRAPVRHSGDNTWAPAGVHYVNNSLYFTGLRGEGLYKSDIQDGELSQVGKYLDGKYGRLRAIAEGPEGDLYISTSNRDGRGQPAQEDDRILRINIESLDNPE